MSRRRSHHAGPAIERYVSVPVRVWDELRRRVPAPEPNATTLYVYCWTSPMSSRVPGVTPAGRMALAEALGWDLTAFDLAFASLESSGLAIADWSARIVFLPEALAQECSRPKSPSTAACWRREVASLPACSLTDQIGTAVRALLGTMGPAFLASYDAGARADGIETDGPPELEEDVAPSTLELVPKGTSNDSPLDFEAIYMLYPRKGDGKSKGFERLKAKVRTLDEYARLKAAVENFAAKVAAERTELRFVPHFSTWANGTWRDYIDGPHIIPVGMGGSSSPPPPTTPNRPPVFDGRVTYKDG